MEIVKKHKIDLSTEDGHQYALMLWAQQPSVRGKWPELALLYHIENERQCSPQQAARRKRMGVKRGVPDLCLPAARHGYRGLYIELKKPGGRVSDEQKWWIGRLTGEGYFATASYGWEQARAVLEWYLEGKQNDYEKLKSPCALCAYGPPSAGDGKPCAVCPACRKNDKEVNEHETNPIQHRYGSRHPGQPKDGDAAGGEASAFASAEQSISSGTSGNTG